jgi:hypothetical protein
MKFIYKMFLEEKEKRGMGCNRNMKVAEMPASHGWHVPRSSRSINEVRAVQVYISSREVTESILMIFSKDIAFFLLCSKIP